MKFRTAIILYATIPIIMSFFATILSQYVALYYSKEILHDYANKLFEIQLSFVRLFTVSINYQIQSEIQKYAIMIYTMNSFQSRVINGMVIPNPQSKFSNLNMELLYDNQEDPKITQIFLKNQHSTNIWFQQNITSVNQLSLVGQNIIQNISHGNFLSRAYQYVFDNQYQDKFLYLKIDKIVSGFSADGLYYSSGQNTTFRYSSPPNCRKGKYNIDVRCLSWFKSGLQQSSLYVLSPFYSSINKGHALSSGICQPLRNYNDTLSSDDIYMVSCVPLYLDKFQIYFQNFINQTKQSYLIEPRTQSIVYNSQQIGKQNTIQYFYNTELSNNTNIQQAQNLNYTIIQNYTQWVYQTLNQANLKQLLDTQLDLITQQQYTKNNKNFTVILNPIFLVDKLPKFKGVKSPQPQGFRLEMLYLQINFLSDEDLRAQANQLQQQFNLFINYLTISLLVFFVIAILATIFYTYRLNQLLEIPIDHLIKILKQMLEEIKSQDLFNIYNNFKLNAEDKFLSKETFLLFQSFEQIFQVLIQTSENFFNDNKYDTLLRLYKKIEFFKQFKNNYALGIIHNNIGSLLLSQDHFFQALEHFSTATLYAQYEIQEFLQNNNNLSINPNLKLFYFNDNQIINLEQQAKELNKSMCSLSMTQKLSQHNFLTSGKKKRYQSIAKLSFYLNKNDKSNSLYQKQAIQDNPNVLYQQSDLPVLNLNIQKQVYQKDNSSLCQQDNEFLYFQNKERVMINQKESQMLDKKRQQSKQNITYFSFFNDKQNLSINTSLQEQLNNLLTNVYYRKKNYALALVSFQENHDKMLTQKKIMYLNSFNFWPEIKKIFKQLLVIVQYLDVSGCERIELLTFISKCYLNQGKFQNSLNCLNQCQLIFNNHYFNTHNTDQKETKEKVGIPDKSKTISLFLFQNKMDSQNDNEKTFKSNNQRLISNTDKENLNYLKSNKENNFQSLKIPQSKTNIFSDRQNNSNKISKSNFCKKIYEFLFSKRSLEQNQNLQLEQFLQNEANHQKQDEKNNLELIFECLRNKSKNQQNAEGEELIFQIFNLAVVDYLIFTKQFQQSVNILAEQFENNHFLYSYLPVQIIIKTNQIFKNSRIRNSGFDHFKQKFNKNIQIKVCFAIEDLNKNYNQCFETLNLLSNLISQTLTKQKDEIGLLYYNQSEQSIQNIVEMIKTQLSRNQIANMIENIFFNLMNKKSIKHKIYQNNQYSCLKKYQHSPYQSIKNQSTSNLVNLIQKNQSISFLNDIQLKSQINSFSQIVEQPNELEDIENLKRKKGTLWSKDFLNIQERDDLPISMYTSIQQSPQRERIENEEKLLQQNNIEESDQSIQKMFKSYKNQQQLQRNKPGSLLSLNTTQLLDPSISKHNYKFNNNNQFLQLINQKEMKNSTQIKSNFLSNEELEMTKLDNSRQSDYPKLKGINFFSNQSLPYKSPQNNGDDISQSIDDLSMDQEEQKSNSQCNFHLLIRKAIFQLMPNNQQEFKSKLDKQKQDFDFFEQMQQIKELNIDIKSQYIIYVTQELLIKQNFLFNKLCDCLFQLQVTLIIFSFKKGNNFIEKCDQGTYVHKERDIIKIFYSIQDIENFINNQRYNITQYIYPTYIQHF
ncbi:hypothetical protein ABPG72_018232 [Tetrahymena utriculariae]